MARKLLDLNSVRFSARKKRMHVCPNDSCEQNRPAALSLCPTAMPTKSREIRLASRPQGEPSMDNFSFAPVEVRDPNPGEVLVRNVCFSVDPYMRGRMNDAKSYVPPFQIGQPLEGGAVGRVIASQS